MVGAHSLSRRTFGGTSEAPRRPPSPLNMLRMDDGPEEGGPLATGSAPAATAPGCAAAACLPAACTNFLLRAGFQRCSSIWIDPLPLPLVICEGWRDGKRGLEWVGEVVHVGLPLQLAESQAEASAEHGAR